MAKEMSEKDFYKMMGGKPEFSYDMAHTMEDWFEAMAKMNMSKANNIRKAMGPEKFGVMFDILDNYQKLGILPPPKEE